MTNLQYTLHARQRLRQRGRKTRDVNLIVRYGTAVNGGGIVLLRQDVDRALSDLKRRAEALQRLANWKVVLAGDRVVSIYPATRRHLRRATCQ